MMHQKKKKKKTQLHLTDDWIFGSNYKTSTEVLTIYDA